MTALGSNVYELRGRNEIGHIPPMPLWVAIIRIFQAVRYCHYRDVLTPANCIFKILAIIILALTAFADSVFKYTVSYFSLSE